MKRKIALLLSAVLLAFSFTACSEKYTEVLTVDGEALPAGIYLMSQLSAYSEALGKVEDSSKDPLKQTVEGQDTTDWIHSRTLELCRNYVWAERTFEEKGMSISEEEMTAQQSKIDTNWESYSAFYEKNGIGKESYSKFFLNNYKMQQIYDAYMEEPFEVTDQEAKSYLDSDYARMDYFMLPLISFSTYQALSEESATAVRLAGDSMASALNDGSMTVEDAVKKYVKDAYGFAGDNEVDFDTDPTSYLYSSLIDRNSSSYNDQLIDALFAAEVDGPWAVSEQGSFYVVYHRTANYADEAAFQELKESIVKQMHSDRFYDEMEGAYNAYELTEDAGAVRHYSVKNIKVD